MMPLNRTRARQWMHQCSLDVLIAASPLSIAYFTDYACWVDPLFKRYMIEPGGSSSLCQSFAVLPVEDPPTLIVNPVFLVNALSLEGVELATYGSYGPDDSLSPAALDAPERVIHDLTHRENPPVGPVGALLDYLRRAGFADARIGIDREGIAPESWGEVTSGLPKAQLKDASNLIRLIRMIKSPEEIKRLTRASQINEQAALESLALAKPGLAVSEMVAHYHVSVARQGALFDHFAYGINGQGIATEADYRLKERDVLYVDFGCNYKHYYSDSGTTLALGPWNGEFKARHAALHSCMSAAQRVMRPGLPVSEVEAVMWAVLEERGLTRAFPHGHGLGLEVRDYPIIVKRNGLRIKDDCVDVDADLPLEADMVINLESAYFMPGNGSVHMERSYLITVDGCRDLHEHDRSAPIQPGA